MMITTANAGVKRDLDKLIKQPRDGITVRVVSENDASKQYEVSCGNLIDLAHAVPGLSGSTAKITLG